MCYFLYLENKENFKETGRILADCSFPQTRPFCLCYAHGCAVSTHDLTQIKLILCVMLYKFCFIAGLLEKPDILISCPQGAKIPYMMTEDCLILNVVTPHPRPKSATVMVGRQIFSLRWPPTDFD